MARRLRAGFTLAVAVFALFAGGAEPSRFRAGAATADITPELGSIIIGGFSPTPATHVHDPLLVRALVLDDGVSRVALVTCDNIGLPREVCDEAKRVILERSGLEPARVLIAATHTHSAATAGTETSIGPNPGRSPADLAAYQRLIAVRIADAVQCAINQLEPARIAWGSGRLETTVFNRRWHVSDESLRRNPFGGVDEVRMNPPAGSPALVKPAGPTDPEIPFISVQASDGRPIALFATYSLHYVGGVPRGVVSADYFGVFCARIGELLDGERRRDPKAPPFVALLANGTSGDINNIDFRTRRPAAAPFEQIHRVANQVAAEVYRACQHLQHRDGAALDGRFEELTLRSRKPTLEMVERARALIDGRASGPPWHPLEKSYAHRVLQRAAAPDTVTVPLQVLRIGDLALMAVPVEAFAEMGLALKARAPFAQSFTVGLANGYYGYLPTAAQLQLGGYETWVGTNRLEPGAAEKMTDTLLRLAAALRPPVTAN